MSDTSVAEPFGFGEFPTSKKLNDLFRALPQPGTVQQITTDIIGLKARVDQLAAAVTSVGGGSQLDPSILTRLAAAETEINDLQAAINVTDPTGTITGQISGLRTDLNAEAGTRASTDTTNFNTLAGQISKEASDRDAQDQAIRAILNGKQAALGFTPVEQGGVNKVTLAWAGNGTLQGYIDNSYALGEIWSQTRAPASLGASGWQRLPSGLVLQYGFTDSQNGYAAPCIFPTAFSYCLAVFVMSANAAIWLNPNTGECYPRSIGIHTYDAYGFTFTTMQTAPNGATSLAPNEAVRFLAIGT